MILSAKTDKGLKRENNQDAYSFGELVPDACYAVVCDGMGGAAEGETASNECARIVSERITNGYSSGMSDLAIKSLLTGAVDYANKYVYSLSLTDKKYEGMGTTIVASIVTEKCAYVVHAGDSRAYLLNPDSGEIIQITKDHSVVQKMIEDGEITAEEAVTHPKKNLITRAVGVDGEVKTDFCQEDVSSGDILLLCSDGLTNYSQTSDLLVAARDASLDEYTEKLVSTAIGNGGGDNVTVVAVRV